MAAALAEAALPLLGAIAPAILGPIINKVMGDAPFPAETLEMIAHMIDQAIAKGTGKTEVLQIASLYSTEGSKKLSEAWPTLVALVKSHHSISQNTVNQILSPTPSTTPIQSSQLPQTSYQNNVPAQFLPIPQSNPITTMNLPQQDQMLALDPTVLQGSAPALGDTANVIDTQQQNVGISDNVLIARAVNDRIEEARQAMTAPIEQSGIGDNNSDVAHPQRELLALAQDAVPEPMDATNFLESIRHSNRDAIMAQNNAALTSPTLGEAAVNLAARPIEMMDTTRAMIQGKRSLDDSDLPPLMKRAGEPSQMGIGSTKGGRLIRGVQLTTNQGAQPILPVVARGGNDAIAASSNMLRPIMDTPALLQSDNLIAMNLMDIPGMRHIGLATKDMINKMVHDRRQVHRSKRLATPVKAITSGRDNLMAITDGSSIHRTRNDAPIPNDDVPNVTASTDGQAPVINIYQPAPRQKSVFGQIVKGLIQNGVEIGGAWKGMQNAAGFGLKINQSASGGNFYKTKGDAPIPLGATFDGVQKVAGDTPAGGNLQGDPSETQDFSAATATFSTPYGAPAALWTLCEDNLKSSFATEGVTWSDIATSVITQNRPASFGFNARNLSVVQSLSGSTWHYPYSVIDNGTGGLVYEHTNRLIARAGEVNSDSAVPLLTSFDYVSLLAADLAGQETLHSDKMRLNNTTFNATLLRRFVATFNDQVSGGAGYGWTRPILNLISELGCYAQFDGDGYGTWFDGVGSVVNFGNNRLGGHNAQNVFPYTHSMNTFNVEMRVCSASTFMYIALDQQVPGVTAAGGAEFADAEWQKALWWPFHKVSAHAVAVIFVRQEDIGDADMMTALLMAHLENPWQTHAYDFNWWEYNGNAWAQVNPGNAPTAVINAGLGIPCINRLHRPGPDRKALFVVVNASADEYLTLKVTNFNAGVTEVTSAANRPFPNPHVGVNFDIGPLAVNVHASAPNVERWKTAVCKALEYVESVVGNTYTDGTAKRIYNVYSVMRGQPKIHIRAANGQPSATAGYYRATSRVHPGGALDQANNVATYATARRMMAMTETCLGTSWNPQTLQVNADNALNWNFEGTNYTGIDVQYPSSNPIIDFMIYRGLLSVGAEASPALVSSSPVGSFLALREANELLKILSDGVRQKANETLSMHYNLNGRYANDPDQSVAQQVALARERMLQASLINLSASALPMETPSFLIRKSAGVLYNTAGTTTYCTLNLFNRASMVVGASTPLPIVNKYVPAFQWDNSIINLTGGEPERGRLGFFMRNMAVSSRVDIVASSGDPAYELMLRKLTMTVVPGQQVVNPVVFLYDLRSSQYVQLQTNFNNATSGLAFGLAYAPFNNGVTVVDGASMVALPTDYKPPDFLLTTGSPAVIAFTATTMLPSLYGNGMGVQTVVKHLDSTSFSTAPVPARAGYESQLRPFSLF